MKFRPGRCSENTFLRRAFLFLAGSLELGSFDKEQPLLPFTEFFPKGPQYFLSRPSGRSFPLFHKANLSLVALQICFSDGDHFRPSVITPYYSDLFVPPQFPFFTPELQSEFSSHPNSKVVFFAAPGLPILVRGRCINLGFHLLYRHPRPLRRSSRCGTGFILLEGQPGPGGTTQSLCSLIGTSD